MVPHLTTCIMSLSSLYPIITMFFFPLEKYVRLFSFFHVTHILFCKSLLFTIIISFSLLRYVSLIYFFCCCRSTDPKSQYREEAEGFGTSIERLLQLKTEVCASCNRLSLRLHWLKPLPPSRLCLLIASYSSLPLSRRHLFLVAIVAKAWWATMAIFSFIAHLVPRNLNIFISDSKFFDLQIYP